MGSDASGVEGFDGNCLCDPSGRGRSARSTTDLKRWVPSVHGFIRWDVSRICGTCTTIISSILSTYNKYNIALLFIMIIIMIILSRLSERGWNQQEPHTVFQTVTHQQRAALRTIAAPADRDWTHRGEGASQTSGKHNYFLYHVQKAQTFYKIGTQYVFMRECTSGSVSCEGEYSSRWIQWTMNVFAFGLNPFL